MEGLLLLAAIVLIVFIIYRYNAGRRRQAAASFSLPVSSEDILQTYVAFYRSLNNDEKTQFRERVREFLSGIQVTGVGGVVVEDKDRIFVGASAVIPIFRFDGWRYNNIDEVLLYKEAFSKDYRLEGADRNVLGMVGDGAMHRQMILSQPSLRSGFMNPGDGQNTAIHEFVHLLDKADGATDGLPEYLLDKPYITPWLTEIHRQIEEIRRGHSDINAYAGTNEAEFFAVASEYFFEKPQMLQEHHPELFSFLQMIFQPALPDNKPISG